MKKIGLFSFYQDSLFIVIADIQIIRDKSRVDWRIGINKCLKPRALQFGINQFSHVIS